LTESGLEEENSARGCFGSFFVCFSLAVKPNRQEGRSSRLLCCVVRAQPVRHAHRPRGIVHSRLPYAGPVLALPSWAVVQGQFDVPRPPSDGHQGRLCGDPRAFWSHDQPQPREHPRPHLIYHCRHPIVDDGEGIRNSTCLFFEKGPVFHAGRSQQRNQGTAQIKTKKEALEGSDHVTDVASRTHSSLNYMIHQTLPPASARYAHHMMRLRDRVASALAQDPRVPDAVCYAPCIPHPAFTTLVERNIMRRRARPQNASTPHLHASGIRPSSPSLPPGSEPIAQLPVPVCHTSCPVGSC
jgi:hypothetical protein